MKTFGTILILVAALAATALAAGPEFTAVYPHYAAIQKALTSDTLDGVTEQAVSIAGLAGEQDASLAAAAGKVAAAKDLKSAREAYAALSEQVIALRPAEGDALPVVAYCQMAKHYWLQDGKDIANPYFGKDMRRCGEVVPAAKVAALQRSACPADGSGCKMNKSECPMHEDGSH